MIKNPRAALRSVFIIVNNMYCIPTYLILMLFLLPFKLFDYKLYYRIEGLLFHWLLANVSMWSWMAGYDCELNLHTDFNNDSNSIYLPFSGGIR